MNISEIKKPISFFSIGIVSALCIFFFYMGYLYYDMWKEYGNPERVVTACIYFFGSGFQLSAAISHILVRYNFIRKSDLENKK